MGHRKSNPRSGGGAGKPSLNRATYKRCAIDPKPDELALARMKVAERRPEVRTGGLFKTFG